VTTTFTITSRVPRESSRSPQRGTKKSSASALGSEVERGVERCDEWKRLGVDFYSDPGLGRVSWVVAVANPRTRAGVRAVARADVGRSYVSRGVKGAC
jgi:hypothetical protein